MWGGLWCCVAQLPRGSPVASLTLHLLAKAAAELSTTLQGGLRTCSCTHGARTSQAPDLQSENCTSEGTAAEATVLLQPKGNRAGATAACLSLPAGQCQEEFHEHPPEEVSKLAPQVTAGDVQIIKVS